MSGNLWGVSDERLLQVDPAFVRKNEYRPQTVREFVTTLLFAVCNIANARVCLNQLSQIAHVSDKPKRE